MSLELCAANWLRWHRRCLAVLHERTPRQVAGQPDCLGITRSRYTIEVEIKRSLSDFHADKNKRSRRYRERLSQYPKEFWYLVPSKLSEQVKSVLPEWAGLAMMNEHSLRFVEVIPSPINRESQKLTVKECVNVFHKISNQLHSSADFFANEKYFDSDYQI
jgi:hypothetical protein